jgi:hypothetical protein
MKFLNRAMGLVTTNSTTDPKLWDIAIPWSAGTPAIRPYFGRFSLQKATVFVIVPRIDEVPEKRSKKSKKTC